jgi:stearoyl-CoA 9-desaturase NADPH oxidoreductase
MGLGVVCAQPFTGLTPTVPITPTAPPIPLRPVRGIARRVLSSDLLDALAAPHGVDRYLELVRPSWSLREARAEVVAVRRQTAGSVTLTLRPNENWKGFRAGQFVRLTVEIDGVRQTRCYSPACSEHTDDGLEITVKSHPEGLVSGFLNRGSRAGMVVGLSAADGDFVLPADRPRRLLLISGGSGITPVMSMLRTLCDEGHGGDVTFAHYAPTRADAIYASELDEIARCHRNVRVAHAYTRESGGALSGHLTREQLRAIAPEREGAEVYVCGPPRLIESVRRIWAGDGIDEQLHVESFLPPSLALPTERAEGSVSFVHAHQQAPNSGRSLLEQAEQAGLGPQFGCRMGICHTCTCRKRAGRVRNVVTGDVSSADEEDIQICVSVPVGDVELEL